MKMVHLTHRIFSVCMDRISGFGPTAGNRRCIAFDVRPAQYQPDTVKRWGIRDVYCFIFIKGSRDIPDLQYLYNPVSDQIQSLMAFRVVCKNDTFGLRNILRIQVSNGWPDIRQIMKLWKPRRPPRLCTFTVFSQFSLTNEDWLNVRTSFSPIAHASTTAFSRN